MKLETFFYTPDLGWSVDALPVLDSDRTLVIIFGASNFIDQPELIRELGRAYPSSCIVGCSTASEG